LISQATLASPYAPKGACVAPGVAFALNAGLDQAATQLGRSKPLRILALGSSSTFGEGASSPDHAYPAQLESILRAELPGVALDVVNAGVSGESAKEAAARLRLLIARHHPSLVVWQLGSKEGVSLTPVDDFEQTVKGALAQLRAADVDAILVGMQWNAILEKSDHYRAIAAALERLSTQERAPLVRRFEAMKAIASSHGGVEMMSPDGFHLNDLGYHCMAEHVATSILSRLGRAR